MKRLLLAVLVLCGTGLLSSPTLAATCSGGSNCTACKSCVACKNCAKESGTCSVCRPGFYRNTGSTTTTPPSRMPPSRTPRHVPTPPQIQQPKVVAFRGKVTGVTNGDTITVLWQGRIQKVRLAGIDAPEESQAYGSQAKKYTSSLCFDKNVSILSYGLDRYGIVLGWIQLDDGRWLNNEIVKAGYAWWYRQYEPNNPRMAAQEAAARQARRGLWADAHPVGPWEYRRTMRS